MVTGMSEGQAGAMVNVVNSTGDKLATKADIAALRSELKQFATKTDLLVLIGLNFAAISLAVAIIKLF